MLWFSIKSPNELFIASNIKQLGDAQFIVQACNNFDSMLESLREVRFVLRMSSMKQYWGEPWAKKLDATITKAGAKL